MPSEPIAARLAESPALRQRDDLIAAVYLFGSAVNGDAGSASDVDVAVLYRDAPPGTLDADPFGLASDLERELGRPVDLVVLNSAPVDLAIRVLRSGLLVAEPDRARRIRFEVRLRNAYFDLEPILHQYRHVRVDAGDRS